MPNKLARSRSSDPRPAGRIIVPRLRRKASLRCHLGIGLIQEKKMGRSQIPHPRGLYDPQHEHDSCGVGFIVQLKGRSRTRSCEDGITRSST